MEWWVSIWENEKSRFLELVLTIVVVCSDLAVLPLDSAKGTLN